MFCPSLVLGVCLSDSRPEMAEVVEKIAISHNGIHFSSIHWVFIDVQS